MPPVLADILAINGTILSPNDLTNSTAWFTWNSTYGGFASQQEATAAFQKFLQGVGFPIPPHPTPLQNALPPLWLTQMLRQRLSCRLYYCALANVIGYTVGFVT